MSADWIRPIADGEVATTLPLHPPADVTAALTTLQHACADWKPTPFTVKPPPTPQPPRLPAAGPPPSLEAQVCHYIAHPGAGEVAAFEFGVGLVTFLVIAWVFVWWICDRHPHLARLGHVIADLFARVRYR